MLLGVLGIVLAIIPNAYVNLYKIIGSSKNILYALLLIPAIIALTRASKRRK
jgi:hypothetical protein